MRIGMLTALLVPSLVIAQARDADVLDQALIITFRRDNGKLVCLSTQGTLQSLREALQPAIRGVDLSDPDSYRSLVIAIYSAFPCPFTPERPELRAASAADITGVWIFPVGSLKLRHGPLSPAWRDLPGVPPIKCEGVSFHEGGEYHVAQLRGRATDCPTLTGMNAMRALPRVQSWSLVRSGRIRVDRIDVPEASEEWDVFAVQAPFEIFGVKFAKGDLVAYQRKGMGNDVEASQAFRHLQRLK